MAMHALILKANMLEAHKKLVWSSVGHKRFSHCDIIVSRKHDANINVDLSPKNFTT